MPHHERIRYSDRRYPSVEALADDLRRHLLGQPVLAPAHLMFDVRALHRVLVRKASLRES